MCEPLIAADAWVSTARIEASSAISCSHAPTSVVWLDLPLARRLLPRLAPTNRADEWSGVRSSGTATARSLRNVFFSRDSLILYAFRGTSGAAGAIQRRSRRTPVVRLRSPREVARWLDSAAK